MRKSTILIFLALLSTGCGGMIRSPFGPDRPFKVMSNAQASNVVLFEAVVAGPCRPFTARYATDATIGFDVEGARRLIDQVYAAKTLSEAEQVAAKLQDQLPVLENALNGISGGLHGGCVLPVSVPSDPVDPQTGLIRDRRIVCSVGELEAACRTLKQAQRVSFQGRIIDAGSVFYLPEVGGLKGEKL